jgi:serine protease Do
MENPLPAVSDQLARAVESAGRFVAGLHSRHSHPASGILWRPGMIAAANHSVRGEDEISAVLPDGRVVPAKLAGRDPTTDLAVLRIEGTSGSPEFAPDETLRPGTLILGVTRSPEHGLGATMGVISTAGGPWRTWAGGRLDRFLRLDLSFYPGSSGGAVADAQGRILGLATSGLTRTAGLAIPVSTIDRVLDELLAKGRIARGFLGVGLQPVSLPEHLREMLGLDNMGGAIILAVQPGSPAEKAGAFIGDVLVRIEGQSVQDPSDVQAFLGGEYIGKQLKGSVVRGGTLADLTFTVEQRG